jgi:hypothetical protein
LSFLFAFFSRAGITISFLYADAEKNKTKPKYKYYIVVVVVVVVVGELCVCVCARSRFCLRRHHSCVNSLVRDERGGETGRKINGSLSLCYSLHPKDWVTGRPARQTEERRMRCIPEVFLYGPFYCVFWLTVAWPRNETKKETRKRQQ